MTETNRNHINWSYVVIALYAITIFFYSLNTAWVGDEIGYAYSFANGKPIKSLSDVFTSQYAHYFSINGRAVAHILVQIFIPLLGQVIFSICNTIVYCLFIFQIFKFVGIKKPSVMTTLTTIVLIIKVFKTFFIPTCQIGYIWMFTLILFFLNIFFKRYKYNRGPGWLRMTILFIISLLAGDSQEALVIGVGGGLIYYALRHLKSLTRAGWVMLIGFGIGGLILCLSPGSISRIDTISPKSSGIFHVIQTLNYATVSLSLIAIILYKITIKKENLKTILAGNSFLVVAWTFCILFNVCIVVFCNRQLFGAELIAIILSLIILKKHAFHYFWLCLFAINALSLYIDNYFRDIQITQYIDEIKRKYNESDDGVVYIDMYDVSTRNHSVMYYQPLSTYEGQDYANFSLNQEFHRNNPEKPELKLMPTILKGNDNVDFGNRVIYFGEGNFLVFQSKKHPATFTVHRSYYFKGLTYPCDEVPLYGTELKSTPLWTATWVTDREWGIMPTAVTIN